MREARAQARAEIETVEAFHRGRSEDPRHRVTQIVAAVLLGVLGFLAAYTTITVKKDRGDQ